MEWPLNGQFNDVDTDVSEMEDDNDDDVQMLGTVFYRL